MTPALRPVGLNDVPVTPGPDHVPPEGVKPVKVTAFAFAQILNPVPAFANCWLMTFATMLELFTQPFPSVKVYVNVVLPVPATEGVKTPTDVTPVPLQIPPTPVGENPASVTGVFVLQNC